MFPKFSHQLLIMTTLSPCGFCFFLSNINIPQLEHCICKYTTHDHNDKSIYDLRNSIVYSG